MKPEPWESELKGHGRKRRTVRGRSLCRLSLGTTLDGFARAGKILQNLIGPPSWKRRIASCWEKWEIAARTYSEDFEDMVRMVAPAWGLRPSELKTRLAQVRKQFAESAEYEGLTARLTDEFPL